MSAGIHHVTLITRRAQANVDFYVGFLGLRLVKRTGGFEDATQLHLFYGGALGSPGSLVTFLVWEDGASGRTGLGTATELALAIAPESIGFWLTRCVSFDVRHQMPAPEFGEPCLRVTDPDGITIKLVGASGLRAIVPWLAVVSTAYGVLKAEGAPVTDLKDRRYFSSIYVREPAGSLLEFATDGPGLTVDEPPESLGTQLFVPPGEADRADDIRVMLPRIALPGEERDVHPDLPFVYRFHRPDEPDGSTLVLLHGTGGSETDLMPLGQRIAPRAVLVGVRGRSAEEDVLRWFRRLTATRFDQADIRAEAEAFATFLPDLLRFNRLDSTRTTLVGYSNGANFIAAVMLLYPHLVRRAALLRAMLVLDDPPAPNLTDAAVLTVTGRSDPYGPYAPALNETLRKLGARVDARIIQAGHELGPDDVTIVRSWLTRAGSES